MRYGARKRMAVGRAALAAALVVVGGIGATAARADTYGGNGGTGFGGSIGNSTLTVTDGGATLDFSLSTSGFKGNGLAIYLDTVAGGANSTAGYSDTADAGRTVLSGLSSSGRTTATFAPAFGADFGISVEPGTFAGLFNLSTGSNFGFVASTGLDTTATTTLNFSVNKADVGLQMSSGSVAFEASLISTTGFRSNETIAASLTLPGAASDTRNAGFTGTTTFSAANTFSYGTTSAPEPTSLALLGLALIPLAGRRRS